MRFINRTQVQLLTRLREYQCLPYTFAMPNALDRGEFKFQAC